MHSNLITVDPEIHSGTPFFIGTRVPIKTVFDLTRTLRPFNQHSRSLPCN